jgi:hypothetical protein
MVISPPPPNPVTALMTMSVSMVSATEHPKQPIMKVTVDMKKHIRRPNMSENRPYSGWNAVLVIKYEVVNHAALLAALKSELIAAYVEAVMVPSNPERNTLAQRARLSCTHGQQSVGLYPFLLSQLCTHLFQSTKIPETASMPLHGILGRSHILVFGFATPGVG